MPNPFLPEGSAFHKEGNWLADDVGLVAKVQQAARNGTRTLAVVAHVGQGKTAALDAYRIVFRDTGAKILPLALDQLMPNGEQDLLDVVFQEFEKFLGMDALDRATRALKLRTTSTLSLPSATEKLGILQRMVEDTASSGPIHLIIDEAMSPVEALAATGDTPRQLTFYGRLKSLAEMMSAAGGALVVASSPDGWGGSGGVPVTTRDRFRILTASTLSADEIENFLREGLRHTKGDKPKRARNGLGQALLDKHEELASVRHLHARLHAAWENAHRAGATELLAQHLP